MTYSTKLTRMCNGYGCRVFYNGKLVVEARCRSRLEIGPAFRDLFRTLDKLGGDKFTSASRKRKFKAGNFCLQVKHIWHRGTNEGD